MASHSGPQAFWSNHSDHRLVQENIEKILGAVAHLPLKYWKSKMFFKGAKDDELAEVTGNQFPARMVPGKSHPVFSLKPISYRIGFMVCPCTTKKPIKPTAYLHIDAGCQLLYTKRPMEKDAYVLREIRFPIPRSLAYALRFMGEVPENCIEHDTG